MHSQIRSEKPGRCPICGMKLVIQKDAQKDHSESNNSMNGDAGFRQYMPLFIVIGLIFLVTLVLSVKDSYLGIFSPQGAMRYFMAGFFLVFSGFKLLDLKGFAEGYSTYDLLAKRIFSYGYVYPFLELFLGLSYLVGYMPLWLNIFACILM